ncbi:hypothetical protein EI94DRAFT_1754368 [Lactarius quietus]|nr:hypothetical protein EI94DRAFT_1754368 [Lactarius quietus]
MHFSTRMVSYFFPTCPLLASFATARPLAGVSPSSVSSDWFMVALADMWYCFSSYCAMFRRASSCLR